MLLYRLKPRHDPEHRQESLAAGRCPKSVKGDYRQLSFNVSRTLLATLGFPLKQFSAITADNIDEFVFVTAASDNHFDECLDAITLVQLYFPRHTIYFYDLSINSSISRVDKVSTHVRQNMFNSSVRCRSDWNY